MDLLVVLRLKTIIINKATNISVKKDIVLEVSKRLDMNEAKVGYVFDFLFGRYMRRLIKKEGVSTILIPHLGKLHLKYGYFKRLYEKRMKYFHKSDKTQKIRLLRLKAKLDVIAKGFEENDSTCKAHLKNYKIRNKYFTLGKTFEELQQFQNGE